jgi:hypothetical protein
MKKEEMAIIETQSNQLEQSSDSMARAEAEVKSRMIMALKFPRNESESLSRVLKSCDRPEFAEKAFYEYPRGGTKITGISVNLAREFARYWKNIAYGFSILMDDDNQIILEGWAWDLESNTRISEQSSFKKLIYRKTSGWSKPDERDLRELVNKHGAIASRNCLLKLFPRDMLDMAFKAARQSVKKGVSKESIDVVKAKALKEFSEYGISSDDLSRYIDIPADKWSDEELTQLRGIYQALKDGNLKASEIKNPPKEVEASEPVEAGSMFDQMKVQEEKR